MNVERLKFFGLIYERYLRKFKLFGLIYWLYLRKFELLGGRLLKKRVEQGFRASGLGVGAGSFRKLGVPYLGSLS